MIYTFYMKYLESIKPDGIINDSKYKSVINKLDFDFDDFIPYPDESPLYFSCRSLIFDKAIKEFIGIHPYAAIISMGSGLDFRFERIDNGRVTWFDMDLPEVIDIRKKIYPETERLICIPKSALDFSWANEIDCTSNILFIAEGLFIYFTSDQVKQIILFMLNNYPGSMLLFDGCSTFYINEVRKGTPYKFINKMQSLWRWSIDGIYEIEKYSPNISLVNEWHPIEMYGERTPDSLKNILYFSDLPAFVRDQIISMQKVYLLKLNANDVSENSPPNTFDNLSKTILNE